MSRKSMFFFLPLVFCLMGGVMAQRAPIGIFERHEDVGAVATAGSVIYDGDKLTYTIKASGTNMWATKDEFHYAWKRMKGNFILRARAEFLGQGVDPHRKMGWIIRPDLDTSGAHVNASLHGDGLTSLQFRRKAGAVTEQVTFTEKNFDVVQLERAGGKYIMSVARFGEPFISKEVADISLGDDVYVGLYVCSHNNAVTETAVFRDVEIVVPARENFVPYREYIGSNLEVMDLATNTRRVLYRVKDSLQAPNWTTDGRYLLYNHNGLLYRFDLKTNKPELFDTGDVKRNNNDHVYSFDGKLLGISSSSAEDGNVSMIYTLPARGGKPVKATRKGPSYLHGWSPDKKWLVFTGRRNDDFDVYKIPAQGGEEIQLTTAKGVDDGPEYTPDGKYIYFNSFRTGLMQVWRMKPDGSEQTQITNDEFNNWFPHLSPDGKSIVIISFPKDIAPGDHPFYKHVYLRLMPVGGGAPKVIAYLYGGQGTINVPSWSPDGKHIAFVSNTDMSSQSPQQPAYRNASLPIEHRISDLLSRMTIEEKAAQMQTLWVRKPQQRRPNGNFGDRGDFSPEEAAIVMKHGIGEIARQRERTDPRRGAMYANAVQKWLQENTRLGIPAILHDEILHGLMAVGGTNFPTPISLASSWDPDLITKIFSAAALETRLRGSHHVLGPNLDLARDPRWGRTEETYGEDPYLVSRMGVAAIKAIQGPGPNIDGEHVMATAKHFAAHGQPEGGTNTAPGNFSERVLREIFLLPFEAAVHEAGVHSVMPSYNEIDGVPSHKNYWLLEKLLRQEWGFRGLVAADYNGITELSSRHKVAADRGDAAQQALKAGVDIELPDPSCYALLPQLLSEGKVSMADVDKAVGRVLRAKFQLGLFENPFVDVERAIRVTNSQAHRDLAAEAARRSIVLLKNDANLLPLDRGKLNSLAVIGPNAAEVHLGGYSDDPQRGVSVLQGVRDKLGDRVKVNYAEGCKITQEGGNWWNDRSQLADPAVDAKLIAEAVEVAKASDVVLLVVGGNEDTNKEAWADNHLGDRDHLDLVGRQNDLARAVVETGKPVVVLLIHSAPLSINYIAEKVPAILDGFYLGQETGIAVADVLFGDANPAGKLAVSVPRSVGQLPIAYNHKPTARRGYLYTSREPLYPFGFGLSYTSFEYSDLKIASPQIGPSASTEVSVTVKNTGTRAGDEIVQLYIRDVVSSVTRPVMELKDFKRLSLKPGESKLLSFVITPDKLWFWDLNFNRVVEPGAFEIMVGPSSVKHQKLKLEVVAK